MKKGLRLVNHLFDCFCDLVGDIDLMKKGLRRFLQRLVAFIG